MENEATNEELNENVESLETEAETPNENEEYKAKYFYLAAEMQNMQKRFDKEKEGLVKFGNERVLRDMLDVVDNFDRTINALKMDTDEKMKNVVFGIDMINKQLLETLTKYGIKAVNALGEIFDPNFHEAISSTKAEDKKEFEIVEVHQHGYILNERLLRPAKVTVVKNEE